MNVKAFGMMSKSIEPKTAFWSMVLLKIIDECSVIATLSGIGSWKAPGSGATLSKQLTVIAV